MQTVYPTTITSNPTAKTVTATLEDGTNIVIESVSYSNYAPPPGYMNPSFDHNLFDTLCKEMQQQFVIALNHQLSANNG